MDLVIQGIGHAQNIGYEQIKHRFSHPERGIWIDHYAGYNQHGEIIFISLAHDQKEIFGIIKNITKHLTYGIEGNYKKSNLNTILTDSTGNRIGTFEGKIRDSFLIANAFHLQSAQIIHCKQVSRYTQETPDCPVQLYYSEYSSSDNSRLLTLRRFEDGSFSGLLVDLADSSASWVHGSISFGNPNPGTIFVCHFNSIVKKKGEIQFKNDSTLALSIAEPKTKLLFYRSKKFPFKCRTETHLSLQGNSRFPWPEDKSFRKSIQEEVKRWNDKIYEHGIKSMALYQTYNLEFVPIWWTDQIVSGSIRMDDPVDSKWREIPWHYSFRQNQTFTLDDIFDKDSDYRTRISQNIQRIKQNMLEGTNGPLHEFIVGDPFENWSITPLGFSFQSNWHPIYGEFRILIQYKTMLDQIKKNGPLKKMI
ncbi:MAG: hypothetical protein IPM48_08240 [Saprospiraceae bacterium]|nr:hypothetical protein [Saprospiraceae bacterium]